MDWKVGSQAYLGRKHHPRGLLSYKLFLVADICKYSLLDVQAIHVKVEQEYKQGNHRSFSWNLVRFRCLSAGFNT